jgi:hypothetical protein
VLSAGLGPVGQSIRFLGNGFGADPVQSCRKLVAAFIADECPDARIVIESLFVLGVTTGTTTPRQGTCGQGARFAITIPLYTRANKKRTIKGGLQGVRL